MFRLSEPKKPGTTSANVPDLLSFWEPDNLSDKITSQEMQAGQHYLSMCNQLLSLHSCEHVYSLRGMIHEQPILNHNETTIINL